LQQVDVVWTSRLEPEAVRFYVELCILDAADFPHLSAGMLPGGRMFGRAIMPDGRFEPVASILVPGDDLTIWGLQGVGHFAVLR